MAKKKNDDGRVKARRGFAAMDREKHREIASSGGVAAHATGRAHEFTSEEAAEAGKKGGQLVSQNRAHMSEIGRIGGQRSAESKRRAREAKAKGAAAE